MYFRLLDQFKTYTQLGIVNVFRVATYRLSKRIGTIQRRTPKGAGIEGPFFVNGIMYESYNLHNIKYFSYFEFPIPRDEGWFQNPWKSEASSVDLAHWSEISDLNNDFGDIKTIWEASRFDWAPKLAWNYRHNNKSTELDILESALQNWCSYNPVNSGLNWKCGQESSLRVLNVLLAAKICGHDYENPTDGLINFYASHARRVLPTLSYAIAQNNNHGTSEAAGLFIIGAYLERHGTASLLSESRNWKKIGRRWLENRVRTLILEDGSFSQHSVTYHRLMLDTLSFVAIIQRDLSEDDFSLEFQKKAKLATNWLVTMIDDESGDAPNLGSNDGAYIFNIEDKPYRDFRYSAELALRVFQNRSLYQQQTHALISIFNLSEAQSESTAQLDIPEESRLFPDGGYTILCNDTSKVLLRLPEYRFRPGQSDALHVDLWRNGKNLLRDGGSYSYNSDDPEITDYFLGPQSHNTVTFDHRSQMSRLSHFLMGSWLSTRNLYFDKSKCIVSAMYIDYMGAKHTRKLTLLDDRMLIEDVVSGIRSQADLRWRLDGGVWEQQDGIFSGKDYTIKITASKNAKYQLVFEPESRYYLHKENIPVAMATVTQDCTIETTIDFNE